ncbi:MAG TPA: transglycosylase SLT domain-containing protein, partial [Candidatus Binataceae bacterium]|nr:transglycosylase SLT domain-containing protein [Candidatus Binataceae bacterium]
VGRIFEEEHKYDSARAKYQRLIARYPSSEAAEEARFRAPWTYYMTGHYAQATRGFAVARAHAKADAAARDMFGYWEARAREKSGDRAGARELFETVAQSIDSNYYPALAARRVNAPIPDLPAASAPDPRFDPDVQVQGGGSRFHLERALALRALGLRDLEPGELKQLQADTAQQPALRSFVLAGLQSAGAYHDAIVAASAMEKRGEVDHAVAERVRYPRAYWELVMANASRNGLDPYLVVALMRQESWFNPQATSSSDARGLMQLLPVTAVRIARDSGVAVAPVNLYDPTLNVELGTAYLRKLFAMFNGDEIRAVAAYNGGEHAVQEWSAKFPGDDDELVENIGYRETREYVKRVIGGMREYRMLYRSAPPASSSAATQSDFTARAD